MTGKAPEVVKSTTMLDLEARQSPDYVSPLAKQKTVGPGESLVNEDGFVGVDPVYANNANETDAPLASDSGPEKVLEDKLLGTTVTTEDTSKKKNDDVVAKHAAPVESASSASSS